MTDLRIGQGVDLHRFSSDPDRPLVLGGLTFPGPGLEGHSDADAVCHALADALLSAVGEPDIGQLFPDDDPRWAGADSIELLTEAVRRATAAGWRAANADCTVVTDTPRLAPRRAEMEAGLSRIVGAPVRVKGRRPEGLGALGRGEGVMAIAVVLVTAP